MSDAQKRYGFGLSPIGRRRTGGIVAAVAVTVLTVAGQPTFAGPPPHTGAVVSAELLSTLDQQGAAGFFVYLREKADLSGASKFTGDAKAEYVYKQLARTAESSQRSLSADLKANGVQHKSFWISNAIWVNGGAALVNSIAARGDVLRIDPARVRALPEPTVSPPAHVNAVEWGVANIKADQVWATFGVRGEGITVANIDTGAQFDHPALVAKYRGNLGGGTFDHNYNWFDPSNICPGDVPCDNNGHGTHTMGTMVGDDGGSNQIGVAPGARFMLAKGCETNSCSDTALLASAQFVLAPTDLAGNNPRPDLHADVVNNSWGGGGGDPWYQDSVNAWVNAGIFPSFSNGNSGPSCGSAGSPGDYLNTYAAGAYDINNVIAGFSSRGPSAFGGELKPNIGAPGVNVRSSVPGNSYANFNGTSMAAPHVSGTVALIWSAAPSVKGDINATRLLLDNSAVDVNDTSCGGTADDNNVFGEGRLNALQAVTDAPRGPNGRAVGQVTDAATGDPLAGATVTNGDVSTLTGNDGRYSLTLPVGTHTLTASLFGFASESATVEITEGTATTQDFALEAQPVVTVSGTVTDGSGKGWPLYAVIQVAGRPGGPIYTNPATGAYSFQVPGNTTYQFTTSAIAPTGYQTKIENVAVGGGNLVHNISLLVDPACTTPGYAASFGTPVLSEPFDATAQPSDPLAAPTPPAGWSVVQRTALGGWRFRDFGNRGNLTGGADGFAMMDSDFFGIGNTEDSDLVTPTLNLSDVSAPYIRFNSDYRAFSNGFGDLDLSIDGGTTWTTLLHQSNTDRRGPRQELFALTGAGGQSNVKIRFHYMGTWAWWWEVDNVEVLNRVCAPQPGGLVVGFTSDANTVTALNGVTVTSNDNPADKGVSAPTPQDPNIPDGFYWLFSSLTGNHPFTATRAPYQPLTKTVNVLNNGTRQADFALKSGRLTVSPTELTAFVPFNQSRSTTLTVRNTGSAPAQVDLAERAGGFTLLGKQGAQLIMQQIPGGASKGMTGTPTLGGFSGPSPQVDPAWSAIANYPSTVMDNSATAGQGKVYVLGAATGTPNFNKANVYDPSTNAWAALPDMPVGRAKPGVAFVNDKLYVFGGWDPAGTPINTVHVFDPASNSWSLGGGTNPAPTSAPGVGVANGKIYLVGGCTNSGCATGNATVIYDPASGSFSLGATYPHNAAWMSCGGINGKIYCAGGVDANGFADGNVYDPAANAWTPIANMPLDLWGSAASSASGLLTVTGGVTQNFSVITNRSVAYDPATDTWSDLPNSQFARYRAAGACGIYKIGGSSGGFTPTVNSEKLGGLDQCDETSDVPWLSETPASFVLNPGQSKAVTVKFTATPATGVIQPGQYTAQLIVRSDTPTAVSPIPVTMNVLPPPGWGKLQGLVQGTTCGGSVVPINAFIRIQQVANPDIGDNIRADNQGRYGWWLPAGRYDIIVAKDGWTPKVVRVKVERGIVLTTNFMLTPFEACPPSLGGV